MQTCTYFKLVIGEYPYVSLVENLGESTPEKPEDYDFFGVYLGPNRSIPSGNIPEWVDSDPYWIEDGDHEIDSEETWIILCHPMALESLLQGLGLEMQAEDKEE